MHKKYEPVIRTIGTHADDSMTTIIANCVLRLHGLFDQRKNALLFNF